MNPFLLHCSGPFHFTLEYTVLKMALCLLNNYTHRFSSLPLLLCARYALSCNYRVIWLGLLAWARACCEC